MHATKYLTHNHQDDQYDDQYILTKEIINLNFFQETMKQLQSQSKIKKKILLKKKKLLCNNFHDLLRLRNKNE